MAGGAELVNGASWQGRGDRCSLLTNAEKMKFKRGFSARCICSPARSKRIHRFVCPWLARVTGASVMLHILTSSPMEQKVCSRCSELLAKQRETRCVEMDSNGSRAIFLPNVVTLKYRASRNVEISCHRRSSNLSCVWRRRSEPLAMSESC